MVVEVASQLFFDVTVLSFEFTLQKQRLRNRQSQQVQYPVPFKVSAIGHVFQADRAGAGIAICAVFLKLGVKKPRVRKLLVGPQNHVFHEMWCFVNVFVASIFVTRSEFKIEARNGGIWYVNEQSAAAILQDCFFDRMFHRYVLWLTR